jgi:hypothetical protein
MTTQPEGQTPRTDAVVNDKPNDWPVTYAATIIDHARTLERENADLRQQLAALTTPQPGAKLPDLSAVTFEQGHGCPSCGRLYTAPPSGHREGMLRAAEILRSKHNELSQRSYPPPKLLLELAEVLRAEAEKLPETPELYDSLAAAFKRHRATQEKLPQDSEWRSHDNSGMRYPESGDTSGGETDAEPRRRNAND